MERADTTRSEQAEQRDGECPVPPGPALDLMALLLPETAQGAAPGPPSQHGDAQTDDSLISLPSCDTCSQHRP